MGFNPSILVKDMPTNINILFMGMPHMTHLLHLLPVGTPTGDQIYNMSLCWGRGHLRFKFHHNEKEYCMEHISVIDEPKVNRERNIAGMGGIKPIY